MILAVSQAAGRLQDHHHQSDNLSVRTVYSPTPEMAIIHKTKHDAIHTVKRPARESSNKELTKPTESHSSEQASMQYSD